MKIAVLADVHANLPALECVVRDLRAGRVKEVWCLGDYLGQGPFPNDVVGQLRSLKARCIIGNHDQKVLRYSQRKKTGKISRDPAKAFSLAWTSKQLRRPARQFLKGLPEKRRLRHGGRTFLLVHGSPYAINEPLKKDTPLKRFRQIALEARADVVLFGHTHVYFHKTVRGVLFVNPGSVGRSYDGDPRASYAVLDVRPQGVAVHNVRLDYDVKRTTDAMVRARFPMQIPAAVSRGQAVGAPVDHSRLVSRTTQVGRSYGYEKIHSHQVAKLALKLFDDLKSLHRVEESYRPLLHSAALLHDIGWVKGRTGHHKTSRDFILQDSRLPLAPQDRVMAALLARYHRRALPQRDHKYYRDLPAAGRRILGRLAALLRLADGMDRAHASSVRDLACRIGPKTVRMRITSGCFSEEEKETVRKKADLFERAFGKKVRLEFASSKKR